MNNKFTPLIFIFIFFTVGCEEKQQNQSYLALGDSYTIGEAVPENERWPIQLVEALKNEGVLIDQPKIIAQTGWTTADLKNGIDSAVLDFPYDWVSLLIGVNNQYQGKSIEAFKVEFEQLLGQAILFAGNKKERVFVVSIPDWGSMPFAEKRNREQIATEIDDFNQAIYEVCALQQVAFIDVTPISRTVESNPSFIASDSLHPSGIQYACWVKQITPFFISSSDD